MEKTDYKALAAKLFCFGIFAIIVLAFFKYLFAYTVPFLISWGIAYLVYPIADKLSAKTKFSRKTCSFFLVFLILILMLSLIFLIGNRILYEIQNFVSYLTENSDKIAKYFENAFNFVNSLGEKLPILNHFQNIGFSESIIDNINDLINNVWKSLLERLGSAVPDVASSIVMALPSIFLVSLITVVSCFYFAVDIDIVNSNIKKVLPKDVIEYLRRIKNKLSIGLKNYLKAYCILFIITFFELIVGFIILGVDYAFVLAILISFIDFLTILGSGAILAPWGIILLLMKNYFLGIGILVMFVAMTIVRQIIEPKIVGKSLGVHPIITLITIYIGYELLGIFGMVFLPIVALIVFSKNETENAKK